MAAWWLWVRSDAGRRRRPALVLALLVLVAGGVTMAAAVGGRRNGTAVERAAALTSPGDGWVLLNQPGFDWDTVRDLPEVVTVAEFPVTFFQIEGHPDLEEAWPPASPEGTTELEVPILMEGRLPDPQQVDEVAISPGAQGQGIDIGDHLTIAMLTPEAMTAAFSGQDPGNAPGPKQTVEVVGVTKGSFFSGDLQTTYAFYDRYRANLTPAIGYVNAVVKLRNGAADLPKLQADVTKLAGRPAEVRDASADLKRITAATHLERDALYGFAAAAALAALVLVGQAVVRMVAASIDEVPQLVALGFTRRSAAAAIGTLPAAAAVAGSFGAAVLAYLVSGLFPIGVGRQAEAHPGRHVDWTVVGPGLALLVVLSLVGVLAIARLALRTPRRRAPTTESRLVAQVAAADTPVPLALGVRLALDRGDGRSAVPVRPALVGSVVGVLGVVAALTFGVGLQRASTDARLFGQSFDGGIIGVGEDITPPGTVEALVTQPDIEMVTEIRNAVLSIDGRDVSLFGMRTLTGDLGVRAVRGRLPRGADEIAFAPSDLDALDLDIGDRVRLDDFDATLTVTGEVFSPEISHTSYFEGAQVTDDALRRFVPTDDGLKFHDYVLRFKPGTNVNAAIERLNQDLTAGQLEPPPPTEYQENLKGVRSVPMALGGFLALLAVGAVGHALASTVRRRRHDLAVLRVIGLTRRQARATVAWQATTLAAIGLVFGVPFGVALGRTLWQVVAERTPLLYVAPVALVALVLVPPGAIAVCNAIAAWPAHVAARLRPAESLRVE
jgi:cell division protein FtsX